MTSSEKPDPAAQELSDDPISWAPSRIFLQYTIAALVLSGVFFSLVLYFFAPDQIGRRLSQLVFLLIALVAWYFLRRGTLAASVKALTLGAWIGVTGTNFFHGGVQGPAIVVYPLVVMTVAWLMSRRAALVMAGLTVVVMLGFVVLAAWGWLPTPQPSPPAMYAATNVSVLLCSTLLMVAVVGAYQNRLKELRRASAELARRGMALEASEAKLKATLNAVPDRMFELDLDGRYHDFHFHHSDSQVAMPQSLLGKRVADLLSAEAAATVMASLQEANSSGKCALRQYAVVALGGQRWFELSVARKAAVSDEGPRFIAIARDITQRKNNELALANSLSLLNATLESTRDGVLVVDLDQHWVLHNSQCARLWQLSDEVLSDLDHEHVARRLLDQLEDPHGVSHKAREIYAHPEATSFDILKFKNGKMLEAHSTPQRVDGQVVGRVWSFRDITEVKRLEEELRIAATAFKAHSGIMVTGPDHRILRVNQSFSKITGYTEDEVKGKPSSFMQSARLPVFFHQDVVSGELGVNDEWRGEMWLLRKSGEEYPAQVTVSLIRDEDARSTHCVFVFIDATTDQAREHKRLLDEAAQRSALVREVHHRIKNNLQGVIGILRKYSSKYPEAAVPMQQAISEVQTVSVIHGLQGHSVASSIQMCELTRALVEEIQHLWQTPIALTMDSCLLHWVVAEDEAVPIALVLNELILNAVKHRGSPLGAVSVALREGARPGVLQALICNAGQFVNLGPQEGARHSGLQLISALLPRIGARIVREQHADQVVTLLELEAPVISLKLPQALQ